MPTRRGQVAGAVLGERLYAIGGYQLTIGQFPDFMDANEVLDTRTMTWEARAPLSIPRQTAWAIPFEGRVRLLGGRNPLVDPLRFDLVEAYDPATNTWSTLDPLPVRELVVATALGGDVYVWYTYRQELWGQAGGQGDWKLLPPPPERTLHAQLTGLGSRLYQVGARSFPEPIVPVLHAYEPEAGQWTVLEPPKKIRCNHGAIPFRGLLVLLSGETCEGQIAFVAEGEVYDPRTDTWRTFAPIPTPRDEFAFGVVGDCIYTAGGSGVDFAIQYNVTEVYCAPLAFEWDFGDGSTASGETATHAYAAEGTYTVTLTVTDPLGAQGVDTLTVHVIRQPREIQATVDFDPDTLNPRSRGQWVTVYVELPDVYDPRGIDPATIRMNDALPPVLDPKYGFVRDEAGYIVDHDGDGVWGRMVKFDRSAVIALLPKGTNPVRITGQLADGTPFAGWSDPVEVLGWRP